jgi:hypothetical protein
LGKAAKGSDAPGAWAAVLACEEGEGEGRIRERGQGDTHMKEYLCALGILVDKDDLINYLLLII